MSASRWRGWNRAATLVFSTLVAFGLCSLQSCNPRESTHEDEETAKGDVQEKPEIDALAHLSPLVGSPWLGHATDGALVKIQFFYNPEKTVTICQTDVSVQGGRARTGTSSFTADESLGKIEWEKGSASFDPGSETLTAKFASNIGEHQAQLRRVTAEDQPELKTYRKSIPENEETKIADADFRAALEQGADWWKSDPGWDKLNYVEGVVTTGDPVALIRPAGVGARPKLALNEEDELHIGIEVLLPPSTTLKGDDALVFVVTEIQLDEGDAIAWVPGELNPGAITQNVTALWGATKDGWIPAGPVSILIYLVRGTAGIEMKEENLKRPISNLLQLELELPAAPVDPENVPEAEPSEGDDSE